MSRRDTRSSTGSTGPREASETGAAPAPVLERAVAMLHRSLDVTLVRMCQSFEAERKRVQEELDRRQEELAFMATHDALTGLPNRTLILDRLDQMLVRGRRSQTPVAALFIDLDNFKDQSGMQEAVRSRMELEMDLREALEKEEFFLVYQPTFDLQRMTTKGMEALLRRRHPERDAFVAELSEALDVPGCRPVS